MRRNPRMISSALARVGQKSGLTIRKRAVLLGVSYGHLAEVERGALLPSPELRDKMAQHYGCSLEDVEKAAKFDRDGFIKRITEHAQQLSAKEVPDGSPDLSHPQ